MTNARPNGGFTLVESVVALAVVSAGIVVSLSVLSRGTDYGSAATSIAEVRSAARFPRSRLSEYLQEADFDHVDTTMRLVDRASSVAHDCDRFPVYGMGQCTSSMCGFHTRPDASRDAMRLQCGTVWQSGTFAAPYTAGKVLAPDVRSCPYDDSPLSQYAIMDVVKFFRARGADGAFRMNATGHPVWNVLAIVLPVQKDDGTCDLKLFQIDLATLGEWAEVTASTAWNAWTPESPTMIDLLDFGGDGTTNGARDGLVPTTSARSDADYEFFSITLVEGEPTRVIMKQLNEPGALPNRRFEMTLRLRDGHVEIECDHNDSASETWSLVGSLDAAVEVLAAGVTEFAASTSLSSPFDETDNPTGVAADRIVRITLGTSRRRLSNGRITWQDHVEPLAVSPRNG